MAQLLAPYHSGMRIGTGFNSYTQQLCVNDAVIKENKEPATIADLRPQGTPELSQTVKWSGRFVESAGDVLNSLDISGALSIKFGSSGSAKGEGAYLKTSRIKDSQINYFLDVTVTNQRLLAADVTKFNTVPNCPKGQFTEVYGDSFISGFLEGGTFHALVSIKVDSNDDIMKVRGALEAQFKAGPVDLDAKVSGAYEDTKLKSGTSTTISVDWTGGGTLTEKGTKEWTIDALKATAYAFPAKCASFPQYTHAILTKYTALRSYQELANKGTPLDYENAGTYTKTLLESYLDYKQIWSDIDLMAQKHQANLNRYTQNKDADPLLASYAEEYAQVYDRQCRAFYYPDAPPYKATKAITAAKSATPATTTDALEKSTQELAKTDHEIVVAKKKLAAVAQGEHFEPPLKPNALVMYPPTILGFDRARRDCRWEMIKIVKEVDAVTNDPTVAIDPNRVWQYLHPTVFRLLLPRPDPPLPPYTPQWVDEVTRVHRETAETANSRAAKFEKLAEDRAAEITQLKSDLDTSQKSNKKLQDDTENLKKYQTILTDSNSALTTTAIHSDNLVKQREAELERFKQSQPKTEQDLNLKVSSLEKQVAELRLAAERKNGLDPMYSGKWVFIVNIDNRKLAWDGMDIWDDSASMRRMTTSKYDAVLDNTNQLFKLEHKTNGTWTIKNYNSKGYLEPFVYSNPLEQRRWMMQNEIQRPVGTTAILQEWWITWVRGGLTFEPCQYPGWVAEECGFFVLNPRKDGDARQLFSIFACNNFTTA